jgi:aryl-alcohol dehydrogenase-like predicted oxidoreductase
MTSNPETAHPALPKRILGPNHLSVGPIGLGCMTMTWAYGSRDRAESMATIRHAVDLGVTLFDTADIYGPFANEELVGEAIQGYRHQIVLATKCGLTVPDPKEYHQDASKFSITPNGRAEHIREACEDSLRRLRTDVIDLYQLHRVDPKVPIEESVGEMGRLVSEGKIRFIGLSECTVEELERAQRVHPITSVQSELSLWTRDALMEVLPFCKDHRKTISAQSFHGFAEMLCQQTCGLSMESRRSPNGTRPRPPKSRWLGSWLKENTSYLFRVARSAPT